MTFHIGQQNAAIINNIAGDQRVAGGQHGTVATSDDARRAICDLREALTAARIEGPTASSACEHVAGIDAALRESRPDRSRVAPLLERLVRLLRVAGSLTSSSAALLAPLHTLVSWLGPLGAQILSLIPG